MAVCRGRLRTFAGFQRALSNAETSVWCRRIPVDCWTPWLLRFGAGKAPSTCMGASMASLLSRACRMMDQTSMVVAKALHICQQQWEATHAPSVG